MPDLPGTFVAQLIVNDGFADSAAATTQILAVLTQTQVTQNIQSLQQVIANLAPGAFRNANLQNGLLNKFNAVIASIEAGNYSDALGHFKTTSSARPMAAQIPVRLTRMTGLLTVQIKVRSIRLFSILSRRSRPYADVELKKTGACRRPCGMSRGAAPSGPGRHIRPWLIARCNQGFKAGLPAVQLARGSCCCPAGLSVRHRRRMAHLGRAGQAADSGGTTGLGLGSSLPATK